LIKKIGIVVLVIFVVIQFIRPEKNTGGELITADDLSKTVAIKEDVHQLLIKKCYECHSTTTTYPWYFNIQPVGWWLAHHVEEGKQELNFSAFKTYPEKKALHKLEEIGEVTEEGSMPLSSYTILHPETKLTPEDKALIASWLKSMGIAEHHD
jgi:hypothetical protein